MENTDPVFVNLDILRKRNYIFTQADFTQTERKQAGGMNNAEIVIEAGRVVKNRE